MTVKKQSEKIAVRGKEVFHGRIASEYRVLRRVVDRFARGKIKVAYRAGGCSISSKM